MAIGRRAAKGGSGKKVPQNDREQDSKKEG
jgi:hypothetical protein